MTQILAVAMIDHPDTEKINQINNKILKLNADRPNLSVIIWWDRYTAIKEELEQLGY